jgi:hypothetical protein
MTLEQLCVSLDLAKKLKEIGVEQNAIFHWVESPHLMQYDAETKEHKVIETRTDLLSVYYYPKEEIDRWSAFNSSELAHLLPQDINRGASLKISKGDDIYFCEYGYGEADSESKTLADCLAKMIIELYENGLLPENKQ